MRLFACLIAVSLPAMLATGCLTVSADECWPNTSGGLGGSGPIPIGAGVGAITGGDYADPPRGPLDNGGAPYNPCTAPETPKKPPPESTCQAPTPSGEGATSWSCSAECSSKCPAPGRNTFVSFDTLEFPFVTKIKDDGTDKGGGYQEAKVNLEFVRMLIPISITSWWCPFTIGMPLRTEGMGKISATLAASLSSEITVGVARDMDYDLTQGIFCWQFVEKVNAAFILKYPSLKASAMRK
ncbi:MAG: hypothetical protein ACMG6S_37220 [Byssovorax sp.]